MKKLLTTLIYSITLLLLTKTGFGQANTTLSNLTSPTAVNQDLLPGTTSTLDLGSPSKSWNSGYFNGSIFIDGNKFVSDKGPNSTWLGVSAGTGNTGSWNTGVGYQSLTANTSGRANTAIGYQSLFSVTVDTGNTAAGWRALYNDSGYSNVGIGQSALYTNVGGHSNYCSWKLRRCKCRKLCE